MTDFFGNLLEKSLISIYYICEILATLFQKGQTTLKVAKHHVITFDLEMLDAG